MTTALYTHPDCLTHLTGPGHPERPERLAAILRALEGADFARLERRAAPEIAIGALAEIHAPDYVGAVFDAIPESGLAALDGDTIVSSGSGMAARRAAGAAMAAVDAVMRGEIDNAFCAIRPPGHHAEYDLAMGFCLFNNAVIAAHHARSRHGLARIAIVDFDVHHGNGSQHMIERDPAFFYASTHQMPLYPGTGAAGEQGCGNVCNAPLPPGAGSAEFRAAMSRIVLPALAAFRPQFVVVSAGFDAHRADPLAFLRLEAMDFAWATEALLDLAAKTAENRLISLLEGGYDLAALAESAAAHVKALMGAGR